VTGLGRLRWPALGLLALAAGGCAQQPAPAARINYYLESPRSLKRIRRVVFVELDHDGRYPHMARDMSRDLLKAIQARKLFHLRLMSSGEPLCRDLGLDEPRRFTMEDLGAIRDALHCDAVLVGRMLRFSPYPHTQMGLYLSLLDLRRGRMVWGVDHTWDGTDKATEQRIYAFFARQNRSGYGPLDGELGLVSPRHFRKFVAAEAAGTLTSMRRQIGMRSKVRPRCDLYEILTQ
jgi:hypothetical protein